MEYDVERQAIGPQFGELPKKAVRKVEHFWLCGSCSLSMTLIMNCGKVETVALEPTGLPRAAAS